MQVSDRISGLFFAAFGLVIIAIAWGYRNPTGVFTSPALFPMIVGAIIIACGLGVAAGLGAASEGAADDTPQAVRPTWGTLAALAVVPLCILFYILAAHGIGSTAAGVIVVLAPALVWRVRLVTAVVVAVVASLSVNALFILGLRVPLPGGVIERLLF